MEVEVLDVDVIKEHLTSINIVETHEKTDDGTLSTSRLTNQGHVLSWIDANTEVSEYKVFLSSWISEPDVLKLDLALDVVEVQALLGVLLIYLN